MTSAQSIKDEHTFSMSYTVKVAINAPPQSVWAKLTDAEEIESWNSTVESLKGEIALGKKLAITVPVAPGRTFTPKVVEMVPKERMVWQDGFYPMFQGTRVFKLTPADGGTEFEMEETFRGVMLPLIKGSLPDFRPVFDTYAQDLKKVCEGA